MKAPTPRPKRYERSTDYIRRVVEYLNRPHRRRLGDETAAHIMDALDEIDRRNDG